MMAAERQTTSLPQQQHHTITESGWHSSSLIGIAATESALVVEVERCINLEPTNYLDYLDGYYLDDGSAESKSINDQRIKIGMDEKNQENKNAYMK